MNKNLSPIIPGLIDELGRECLIRLSYHDLPTASRVCKPWRDEITALEFRHLRKTSGVAQSIIILAQAQTKNLKSYLTSLKQNDLSRPTYGLTLSDPETRTWIRLPMIPGMPDGLPMFCGLVGSGSDILIIGGWNPVTLRTSRAVYIYSLLSGKWRKGAEMPGVKRSFFGCTASQCNRTVLVAGGHNEDKNALKSAMLYNAGKDEWVLLPDMYIPRDECKAVFHRGKFHVISGYQTETQGCFDRTAEVLDSSKMQWGPVIENFLEASASPSSCVASDGRVYACVGRRSGNVAVHVDDKWQVIAKVPADVRSSQWVGAYGTNNKVLVIGSSRMGESYKGYMLDLKGYKWSKIDVPKGFCGHVQGGCVLEI